MYLYLIIIIRSELCGPSMMSRLMQNNIKHAKILLTPPLHKTLVFFVLSTLLKQIVFNLLFLKSV